jgi:hypothetical protein
MMSVGLSRAKGTYIIQRPLAGTSVIKLGRQVYNRGLSRRPRPKRHVFVECAMRARRAESKVMCRRL